MSPEGSASAADQKTRAGLRLDRRTLVPALAILALIVVPVVIWGATSEGGNDGLRIDQSVSPTGSPEIVVNVPEDVNNPAETNNSSNVRLTCVDAGGKTVLATDQDWPFINEPGYELPHVHQPVTPKQMQQIAKCRVAGTKTKLEGTLRRTSNP